MDIFRIKRNDTKPFLKVALTSEDGTAIDLSDSTIQFNLGNSNYGNVYSAAATITDAEAGECEYRWEGTTDTGTVGTFFGEFQITFLDGKIMTMPGNHNLQVEIYEDYD